jgi:arylsulfatase A-like enzyme
MVPLIALVGFQWFKSRMDGLMHLERRHSRGILFIILAVCVVVPAARAAEASKSEKPNVLILFSDDQRADTIAALGNAHIRTPNLDRLVHEGTAFDRAYCMGSWHGAVCMPSRAMLLTGRSLFRVKPDLKGQGTWPEAFARQGYTTFLTGKWHNQPESALRAFQHGKAIFFGGMGQPYTLPIQDISTEHELANKRPSGEHSARLFADAAAEFIRSQKGADAPFLCYVPFNVPHDPRLAPPEYHERYKPESLPLPANFLPEHPFNNGDLIVRDERLAPWPRTPEIVRKHLADYYASIEFLDAQIGRILDALRESGRYENTLIVFASDHGLAIGSHGLFGKQSLYEHSMRAPLIFAGPGIPRGKRTDAMCYLLDIFPTLGALAGVPAPEGNEGLSLAPVLEGRKAAVRDSLFTAYARVQRAVRDDRWKLIVYPKIHKTQLFDLKADPAETHDLAGDSKYAGEVARLTALLKEWQAKLGDTLPLKAEVRESPDFDFSNVKDKPTAKKKAAKS